MVGEARMVGGNGWDGGAGVEFGRKDGMRMLGWAGDAGVELVCQDGMKVLGWEAGS